MTKQDLLDAINSAKADDNLKDMVRGYVEKAYTVGYGEAYSIGFSDGMKTSDKIHNLVLDEFEAKL